MIEIKRQELTEWCGRKGIVLEFFDEEPGYWSMKLTVRVKTWNRGVYEVLVSANSFTSAKNKILEMERNGWLDDPKKHLTDLLRKHRQTEAAR